jgi:molybdenum cofactor cytidylyltransferase
MSVAAIVLAAGLSQRFGYGDKLVAPFRGKQLVRHVADALAPLNLCAKIAVISNSELGECFAGFDIVKLEDGLGGQATSIRAGIARARLSKPDKILIVLADMPGVTSHLLNAIIATATPAQPAAATNGQRTMPPACFPTA